MSSPYRPRVHDVRAARSDRRIYTWLYKITAEVARPAILTALAKTTAREATELFRHDFERLRGFLLDSERNPPDPDRSKEEYDTVLQGFETYLKESLVDDSDSRLNETLLPSLSDEFARVLWSAWLRRMRAGAMDGKVASQDLLPEKDATISAAQGREDLHQAVRHFGISPDRLTEVLMTVLARLLSEAPKESSRINLPLGLWIDRSILIKMLRLHGLGSSADFDPKFVENNLGAIPTLTNKSR